ncbi:MAG: twin-arginine translocation signal domain-containing protein, partial [Acidobacteria bacterium]|nr:twin-arginine translocation signal domain-containing protein [Acidobacteriota bacterium]
MLIKASTDIRSSEITPRRVYLNRREFLRAASGTAVAAAGGAGILTGSEAWLDAQEAPHGRKLENVKSSPLSTTEKQSTWRQITTYNNYYEFGTDKESPAQTSRQFNTADWKVAIDGECNKKANLHVEDILRGQTLEDRIYRHRCVEA